MTDELKKLGRTRRREPQQEAIVESKDKLNQDMSNLIHLLIELKKGWNGRPAPEVGVTEKINLTQPLPASIPQYGKTALNELEKIIQELNHVAKEQGDYSSNKMRAREQRMFAMQKLQEQTQQEAPRVTPEPTQEQRQAAFDRLLLVKTASNKLTRLWAHIVAPFASEKGRRERLEMLRGLGRMETNLREIEESVLKGDPGILEAVELAKQTYIDSRASFFDTFRKNLSLMVKATEEELKNTEKEVKNTKFNKEPPPQPPLAGVSTTYPDANKPGTSGGRNAPATSTTPSGSANTSTPPGITQPVATDIPPDVSPPGTGAPTVGTVTPNVVSYDAIISQLEDLSKNVKEIKEQGNGEPSESPTKNAPVQFPDVNANPKPEAVVENTPEQEDQTKETAKKDLITPLKDSESLEKWWAFYFHLYNGMKNNKELVNTLNTLDEKERNLKIKKIVNDQMERFGFVGAYDTHNGETYLDIVREIRKENDEPINMATPETPQEAAQEEAETASTPSPGVTLEDYTEFVMRSVHQWWKMFYNPIITIRHDASTPKPWMKKINIKLRDLEVSVDDIKALQHDVNTKAELEKAYLDFLFSVGEVQALFDAFRVEEEAKKRNPDFEYGSLLNDASIQSNADTFVEMHKRDLQAISSMYQASLVSYGSRLSRFMKRMLQHVSGGKDKDLRLKVDREVRESRKNLQAMMDNLENRHINFRSLTSSSAAFLKSIANTYDRLADLADMYNSRMRIQRSKLRVQNSRMPFDFISSVEVNNIRRMGDSFRKDISTVQNLEDTEQKLSDIQAKMYELQENDGEK